MEQLHIIQDHHHGKGLAGQRGPQPGQDRPGDRGPPGGQHAQHRRIDRLDPVQPNRQVGQQHRRIIVLAVDRQPDKRPRVPPRPLHGKHGLAVPGGRAQGHHRRGRRGLQPVQEADPGDDPGTGRHRGQLGLNDREQRRRDRGRSPRLDRDRRLAAHHGLLPDSYRWQVSGLKSGSRTVEHSRPRWRHQTDERGYNQTTRQASP